MHSIKKKIREISVLVPQCVVCSHNVMMRNHTRTDFTLKNSKLWKGNLTKPHCQGPSSYKPGQRSKKIFTIFLKIITKISQNSSLSKHLEKRANRYMAIQAKYVKTNKQKTELLEWIHRGIYSKRLAYKKLGGERGKRQRQTINKLN